MFSSERNELRKIFFEAWRKHREHALIEPLEAQIIEIILQHPEYHALLNDPEKYQDHDFREANPFLHLSLHLALREQIQTNRPAGIKQIYENLCQKYANPLTAEHSMMECLEKILWEAQQSGKMPDEQSYLETLKKL